jgi:2-oxoisovalerate dehydrogenase E2 component (dihydrolipoyl transacylase)
VVKDFRLPDVGEGLEEATIVEWMVDVGDEVTINQPLCVIETAKAEVELPSPYAGRVVARNGGLGEELRVGEILIRIDTPEVTTAPVNRIATAPAPTRNPVLVGYGVSEESTSARRRRSWSRSADASDPAPAGPAAGSGRPKAKPPVRKLARDLGVDLFGVRSTGPRGEITREDVRSAAQAPVPGPAKPAPASAVDEVIPVRGVRARIAQRMSTSRSTIPEATCGLEVDCTELLRMRKVLREVTTAEGAQFITPFSLIAWMVPRALSAAPMLNSSFSAEEQVIKVSRAVHLGLAASTEQGLLVPVLRDAQALSVTEVAAGVARLADGARQGTLSPTEMAGSTFTITNYGALGLDDGNPVINYPEAAILGIGTIRPQPVAVDDEVVIRPRTKLICAFDHRVCDGAEAARFLTTLKRLVEEPLTSLVVG